MECVSVVAIEVGNRAATLDAARVAGHSDDVFEDGVVGELVEEVLTVDEIAEPLVDDPEQRSERFESGPAGHERGALPVMVMRVTAQSRLSSSVISTSQSQVMRPRRGRAAWA